MPRPTAGPGCKKKGTSAPSPAASSWRAGSARGLPASSFKAMSVPAASLLPPPRPAATGIFFCRRIWTLGILPGGGPESLCRPPHQIFGPRRHLRVFAFQGQSRPRGQPQFVRQGEGLHDRYQVVVTILAPGQNFEIQVDLGRASRRTCGTLSGSP